jgi:hypothetical protein
MRAILFRARLALAIVLAGGVLAATPPVTAASVEVPQPQPDPHYTAVGFFDVRLCHWPDEPRFLQVLFSSTKYDRIRKVEVLDPDGKRVGELALDKFRLLKQKDGSVKRVFITRFPLSTTAKGGWYTGRITTTDGTVYLAKDLVKIKTLPIAANPRPAPNANNISAPAELSWDPVPGARMYQVFVHDIWEGEALIFRSPHLTENRVSLPKGLLKSGGYYMWRVHARDVDEDIDLGDFNDGSLTPFFKFSVR